MARIDDGHQTLITIGAGSTAPYMWEKTVTPPGVEGGGENDITTMHNTTWRTRSPKQLKTLSPMSCRVTYDPQLYSKLAAAVNVNNEITITWPDGSTLKFWGWLDSFKAAELQEGAPGEADITIIPSNQNGSGGETAPVWTAA